ncbi:MAG: type IX secretion system protein PorQ [Saprospiraceae bacterium]|nr:type IX secretion system protein PorQ [Saprospiraceae bacterium]MCB0573154.1 type IX secretion system protein PorQ [Saprospiraceae bacterium]MCB9305698.1 type IX secretion system protein PorQ [Lewinellaceae bacterium]
MSPLLRKIGLSLLIAGFPAFLFCQVNGGQQVFQFMTLSPSARITALGGMQIAVKDADLGFAAVNPAALNPMMDGRLVFQHNFFLSDVQHGYVAYAHDLPKQGFTLQAGLQYLNYGDIKRADEYGNVIGTVPASETAFTLGGARALSDRFSMGLNLRLGLSTLDTYKASALAADAGVMYADTARRFTAAIVIRNAGTQMSAYNEIREDIPFDLQIGISKRLKYLPFRFSIVAHHLHQWDIRYDDPDLQDDDILQIGDGESSGNSGNGGVDNFFRHLVFNGEFLLGRNESFQLRFGYNHLRKKELSVRNYRSLAGFSGGVGIKISRFRIDLGYASYHLAGGVLHLGIGTNLKEFF